MEEENNYHNSNSTEHNIIYFTDNNITNKEPDNAVEKTKLNKIEPTKYIAPVILAVLIYSICAWSTKVAFTEIVDLEIPLIILLTLIITESFIQGYEKITSLICIIISCITFLTIGESYSLLLILSLTGVLIIWCLNKIYYNTEDYPNIDKEGFRIKSIFSRLKYHILLSLIIFAIFLLLGYYYPGVFQPLVMPSVENLHNGVREGTLKLDTIALFLNNFSVAYNMILGGAYFSIPTLYSLVFNALFIGFSGAVTDTFYFLAFTLPHGIIELSAIILAGAGGLRLTHAFLVLLNGIKLNDENRSELFGKGLSKFLEMFVDVIILVIIIVVMLAVAAYIEANLTISIGTFIYNL